MSDTETLSHQFDRQHAIYEDVSKNDIRGVDSGSRVRGPGAGPGPLGANHSGSQSLTFHVCVLVISMKVASPRGRGLVFK